MCDQMDASRLPWRRLESAPTAEFLSSPALKFFGNRRCPFAQRAVWAGCELGVLGQFELIHVDLADAAAGVEKPEWYQRLVNPYGTVPALYEGATPVFDSMNVATYLCERFGGGEALYPADAALRADVRLVGAQWGERSGVLWAFVKTPADDAEALEAAYAPVAALFEFFEGRYEARGGPGPFFLGEQVSLADISWITLTVRLAAVAASWFGRELVPASCPRLRAALAAAQARAAFQASAMPEAEFLPGFEKMRGSRVV